ncbi:MAG TPA: hypothetical protein VHO70_22405 [Chitinispirillaceae bacterium]|nr:hypothetical protein [Chitinispirillaceae bacterium]
MDNNFESKRQEMMRELSKRHRDNVVKRKVATMQKSVTEQPNVSTTSVERKRIAVYGADSYFIKSFNTVLKLTNDVIYSSDVEKLIGMVMDSQIMNIAIDMDPPTDWRNAVDVFTTTKTVNPNAIFYACTKDPTWVQARTLEKQGAIILKKPVDFDHLYKVMK